MKEIKILLARKATADAQTESVRKQYADYYNLIVSKIARLYLDYLMQDKLHFVDIPDAYPLVWDYDINSEILSITLKSMAVKYEDKKAYIEWMCKTLIPEVDISFKNKDQTRFGKCIQMAMQQIVKV